jgi:P27 family predicted phage terminase small subunit
MTKQESDKTYKSTDYRSLTETARTVFKNVCEVLDERGLFHVEDVPIIAGYARNVVLARVAARDIERLGTVIEYMDRGYKMVKTNPAVDIMNKAQNAYEATAVKLGLTPTGRKRLKGEGTPKKSRLEEFNEQFSD